MNGSDQRERAFLGGDYSGIAVSGLAVAFRRGAELERLTTRSSLLGPASPSSKLSVLKNNRGRAIRFTTLTLICNALGTSPGALFSIDDRLAPDPSGSLADTSGPVRGRR